MSCHSATVERWHSSVCPMSNPTHGGSDEQARPIDPLVPTLACALQPVRISGTPVTAQAVVSDVQAGDSRSATGVPIFEGCTNDMQVEKQAWRRMWGSEV